MKYYYLAKPPDTICYVHERLKKYLTHVPYDELVLYKLKGFRLFTMRELMYGQQLHQPTMYWAYNINKDLL